MYLSPLEKMKKVHIWIGTFSGSEKEYEDYFNLQDSPCRFCIDINTIQNRQGESWRLK